MFTKFAPVTLVLFYLNPTTAIMEKAGERTIYSQKTYNEALTFAKVDFNYKKVKIALYEKKSYGLEKIDLKIKFEAAPIEKPERTQEQSDQLFLNACTSSDECKTQEDLPIITSEDLPVVEQPFSDFLTFEFSLPLEAYENEPINLYLPADFV